MTICGECGTRHCPGCRPVAGWALLAAVVLVVAVVVAGARWPVERTQVIDCGDEVVAAWWPVACDQGDRYRRVPKEPAIDRKIDLCRHEWAGLPDCSPVLA